MGFLQKKSGIMKSSQTEALRDTCDMWQVPALLKCHVSSLCSTGWWDWRVLPALLASMPDSWPHAMPVLCTSQEPDSSRHWDSTENRHTEPALRRFTFSWMWTKQAALTKPEDLGGDQPRNRGWGGAEAPRSGIRGDLSASSHLCPCTKPNSDCYRNCLFKTTRPLLFSLAPMWHSCSGSHSSAKSPSQRWTSRMGVWEAGPSPESHMKSSFLVQRDFLRVSTGLSQHCRLACS